MRLSDLLLFFLLLRYPDDPLLERGVSTPLMFSLWDWTLLGDAACLISSVALIRHVQRDQKEMREFMFLCWGEKV